MASARGSDGRQPRGTVKRLLWWSQKLPVDAAKHVWRLRVDGVADTTVLYTWDAGARDKGEDWSADVLDAAQDDADTRLAVMEYRLELVDTQGDDDRVIATYNIRRAPRQMRDNEALEGPSAEGQVAQQMRHSEALMRQMMEMQRQTFSALGAMLASQDKRMTLLEKTVHDSLATYVSAMQALGEAQSLTGDAEQDKKRSERADRALDLLEVAAMRYLGSGEGA